MDNPGVYLWCTHEHRVHVCASTTATAAAAAAAATWCRASVVRAGVDCSQCPDGRVGRRSRGCTDFAAGYVQCNLPHHGIKPGL